MPGEVTDRLEPILKKVWHRSKFMDVFLFTTTELKGASIGVPVRFIFYEEMYHETPNNFDENMQEVTQHVSSTCDWRERDDGPKHVRRTQDPDEEIWHGRWKITARCTTRGLIYD